MTHPATTEFLLTLLLQQMAPTRSWIVKDLIAFDAGKQLALLPPERWREMLLSSLQRILSLEAQILNLREKAPGNMPFGGSDEGEVLWNERQLLVMVFQGLLRRKLPLEHQDVTKMLDWVVNCELTFDKTFLPIEAVIKVVSAFAQSEPLNQQQLELLQRLQKRLEPHSAHIKFKPMLAMLDEVLNGAEPFVVEAGEAWSDRVIADLKALDKPKRELWLGLLELCSKASGAKPTNKWVKQAEALNEQIDAKEIASRLLTWFELVDLPRTEVITEFDPYNGDPNLKIVESNQVVLRGLIWLLGLNIDDNGLKALAELALSCYAHLPGLGARVLKVGNACLYVLGQSGDSFAAEQLLWLKSQISNRSVQKAIDKTLNPA